MNVIIRQGQVEDAEAMLTIERDVISESNYLITVEEEFGKTLEEQRQWLQNIIENKRETVFVAEVNYEVVGWIVFYAQNRKRLSHTGSLVMMINQMYRSNGIGKLLLQELLDWCENNSFIEKVSLGVLSTNYKAIKLYKNMGFTEEGRKIREFKINERGYADDVLLYKLV
ncbi:GNAT family N-acetyltransferase [Virgibacillus sp. JSM 102003]|uniref:GNAT family N-acetyltransferase n=1 Tax=Virgibacillus sp. JSM 102003 TaxID=1562108 RepID=UPI0035C0A0B3